MAMLMRKTSEVSSDYVHLEDVGQMMKLLPWNFKTR